MSTLWFVASAIGLGGAAYWIAKQAMTTRGQPTSETSVGADPPPTEAGADDDRGPQLRQYMDNLYAKLKAQNLAFDAWGVEWRTVLLLYNNINTEAIVLAADLLPPRGVDLDRKFYHFKTMTMSPKIKTPTWASDEEE